MRQTILDLGKKRARERGGILVIAIIVILAMLILAIPFLFKLSAGHRSTERGARALMAFDLAEAGVDQVMWERSPSTHYSGAAADIDKIDIEWDLTGVNEVGIINDMKTSDKTVMGNVQVVLTPIVGVAPNPRTRTLTSTGFIPFVGANPVERTVRVTLQQEYASIFDVGFFVDEYFYIHSSFFLDAYNSNPEAETGGGPYGAPLAGGGTNSLLPDVYFGSNSYISDTNPNDPGESTWVIDAGGGSSDVYGTIMAGGDEAEAYRNDTTGTLTPPDPSLLDEVISVPREDIFQGTEDRIVMKQEYELRPVDVYNLPPKEILGSMPSVGSWFKGYNSTDPTQSTDYYNYRYNRAPGIGDLANTGLSKGDFTGTSLTSADNGIYTSFKPGSTLNVSGLEPVVIYVTALDVGGTKPPAPASFYLGQGSTINIAPGSKLIVILGNASMVVEKGYNINQSAGKPADCIILGTNQFAFPSTQDPNNLPKKLSQLDDIPGLMYFEHAQSDGNIYSAMYVPGAHIATGQGQNHMNFYGALISKSMDFKVQVDFHYDKALADLKIQTGGYELWKIINWAEVVGGN
jgi:hypothetical protein